MLFRTTLIAATAAIGLTGAVMADGSKAPTILDDQALDNIMAGTKLTAKYFTLSSFEQEIGADFTKLEEALAVASVNSNGVVYFSRGFQEEVLSIQIYVENNIGDYILEFDN